MCIVYSTIVYWGYDVARWLTSVTNVFSGQASAGVAIVPGWVTIESYLYIKYIFSFYIPYTQICFIVMGWYLNIYISKLNVAQQT